MTDRTHPPATGRSGLAGAVAAAVTAVPGVVGLRGGTGVPVATYHPGGRVLGVRLAPDTVAVHVAVDRLPLAPVVTAVADAVRGVLATAADPRRVDVVIEDVSDTAVADALLASRRDLARCAP